MAFDALLGTFLRGDSRLELGTRLAGCLRSLLVVAGEASPPAQAASPRAVLDLARDFIHARFAEPVELDDLVALTGLSRLHLVRSSRRAFGLLPHAYQTQLRVAAAREKLRRGVRPAEIEAGFADQSHLGRHFKRIWGMSPGRYAAAF
jgi:AraC-like DNA-binding protein